MLLLQHVGERSHAFNTARIVRKALRQCQLIVDHNRRFAAHDLPIDAKAGLLFPGDQAPALADLPVEQRPRQLVIIDGTWHQAKTIVRDVPQLQSLPCYRLSPTTPGQYRIRREPDAQSLSTLEATVAALQELEPETAGLLQLLAAFNEMVETQLAQLDRHCVARTRRTRQARHRNLPYTLLQARRNLVVAYGEATAGEQTTDPRPVSWLARRLGTDEQFSCLIRPPSPLTDAALGHMRLTTADLDSAVSTDDFCRRWRQFFGPNDVLVVYHQRTCQLLQHLDVAPSHYLVLKSIFGNWRSGIRSMESLLEVEGLALPAACPSRAHLRLEMAVAMVEHLRNHYAQLV